MIAPSIVRALRRANRPTAIILGLNEITSAIAVRVPARNGWAWTSGGGCSPTSPAGP